METEKGCPKLRTLQTLENSHHSPDLFRVYRPTTRKPLWCRTLLTHFLWFSANRNFTRIRTKKGCAICSYLRGITVYDSWCNNQKTQIQRKEFVFNQNFICFLEPFWKWHVVKMINWWYAELKTEHRLSICLDGWLDVRAEDYEASKNI